MKFKFFNTKQEPVKQEEPQKYSYTDFLRSIGKLVRVKKVSADERFKELFPRTIESVCQVGNNGKAVAMDGMTRPFKSFDNEIPEKMFDFLSQSFIGFQACALLKQNAFIDRACTIPAKDAIACDYQNVYINESDLKADKEDVDIDLLAEIKFASKKKFKINEVCVRQNIIKKTYGYSIVVPQVDGANMELPYNIDGIKPNSYKGMAVIEPYWITVRFDAESSQDPSSPHFYEPTWYEIAGKRIHRSWVIRAVNSEVSDILKPTYFFGGIPLTQQIYERVYAADKVANEAPLLAMTKRLLIADANIENAIANPDEIGEIIEALTQYRDNFGVFFKRPDDQVNQIDTSLTGLDEVIMTQYQLIASIAQMPATKLLKTTPKGFNATGEYEERDYKQSLVEIQENDYVPIIERHNELMTKSMYGKVIPLEVKFNEIDAPTEKEAAEIQNMKSQAANAYVAMGAVTPEEVRGMLRSQENSEYSALEEVMPEPAFDIDSDEDEPASVGQDEDITGIALDEWNESEHPRDEDGKFSGNGGATTVSISSKDILNGRSEEQFRSDMLTELYALNGKSISNASLGGDIEIRTSSIKKYKSFSADIKKMYIIPHLEKMLENANFSKTEKSYDKRETSIRAYYKSNKEIDIDGKKYTVKLTVKEDQKGNYFWDAQIN